MAIQVFTLDDIKMCGHTLKSLHLASFTNDL